MILLSPCGQLRELDDQPLGGLRGLLPAGLTDLSSAYFKYISLIIIINYKDIEM